MGERGLFLFCDSVLILAAGLVAAGAGHGIIFPLVRLTRKIWKIPARYPGISIWIGMLERVMYTGSFLLGYPQFVVVWLGLKTAGNWGAWSKPDEDGRLKFLHNLLFSGLSMLISVIVALLFKPLIK